MSVPSGGRAEAYQIFNVKKKINSHNIAPHFVMFGAILFFKEEITQKILKIFVAFGKIAEAFHES